MFECSVPRCAGLTSKIFFIVLLPDSARLRYREKPWTSLNPSLLLRDAGVADDPAPGRVLALDALRQLFRRRSDRFLALLQDRGVGVRVVQGLHDIAVEARHDILRGPGRRHERVP